MGAWRHCYCELMIFKYENTGEGQKESSGVPISIVSLAHGESLVFIPLSRNMGLCLGWKLSSSQNTSCSLTILGLFILSTSVRLEENICPFQGHCNENKAIAHWWSPCSCLASTGSKFTHWLFQFKDSQESWVKPIKGNHTDLDGLMACLSKRLLPMVNYATHLQIASHHVADGRSFLPTIHTVTILPRYTLANHSMQ